MSLTKIKGSIWDSNDNNVIINIKNYPYVDPVTPAAAYYINITTGQSYGSPSGSPSPPGIGSPVSGSPTLGILETSLPDNWYTIYNGIGNFTIVHNLGTDQVGFALTILFNTTARVINPTVITTNDITFQITDTTDVAVEGNVIGKILF